MITESGFDFMTHNQSLMARPPQQQQLYFNSSPPPPPPAFGTRLPATAQQADWLEVNSSDDRQ